MRVVAGRLRHREIKMTNLDTTRETQDKVRQAVFNMIGPYFEGGIALDLFAGSGAMGIEAYSRGFEELHFVDIHPKALEVCRQNCKTLGIQNARFYNQDYLKFLEENLVKMDMIFLDPPYSMSNTEEILSQVYPHLAEDGIVVFEMAKNSLYCQEFQDFWVWKDKTYGIKRIVIYRFDS